MAKNTGKPYELLTQRVFTAILNEKSVDTIKVEHDVTIQGKDTTHQIDVYWEFQTGGITYRTIVQCKDWAQPVKQAQIFEFTGVLRDVPGQPRGIFVSRTGYQSGAIELAKANGILLYELREPTPEDFGGIHTIEGTLHIAVPELVSANVVPDKEWVFKEMERLGLPMSDGFSAKLHVTHFEDEEGAMREAFPDLVNSIVKGKLKEGEPQPFHHDFIEPTYIRTERPDFPRVKITGLDFTLRLRSVREPMISTVRTTELVGVILRDVIAGKRRAFDHAIKPFGR